MSVIEGFNQDPIQQFQLWYHFAEGKPARGVLWPIRIFLLILRLIRRFLAIIYPPSNLNQPHAVALATSSKDNHPSVRMVLFKGIQNNQFTFYTNYKSRKSQEIEENAQVAIVFHWNWPQRQVRVEGIAKKMSHSQSEQYWKKRDRLSRLSAIASHQSEKIDNWEDIKTRVNQLKVEYQGKEIPCPEFWGGYFIEPTKVEFWELRLHRLHQRVLYFKENDQWKKTLLSP